MTGVMFTGATGKLVTKEAQLARFGTGGTSYPIAHDPMHDRAHAEVAEQRDDWAEVRYEGAYPAPLAFRAWRVSATTYAWQTAAMASPAFYPYTAERGERSYMTRSERRWWDAERHSEARKGGRHLTHDHLWRDDNLQPIAGMAALWAAMDGSKDSETGTGLNACATPG